MEYIRTRSTRERIFAWSRHQKPIWWLEWEYKCLNSNKFMDTGNISESASFAIFIWNLARFLIEEIMIPYRSYKIPCLMKKQPFENKNCNKTQTKKIILETATTYIFFFFLLSILNPFSWFLIPDTCSIILVDQ